MGKAFTLLTTICLLSCATDPPRPQKLLLQPSGRVELPAGVVELSEEMRLPEGTHDLEVVGAPEGTTLRASDDFRGRALLVVEGGKGVTFRGFEIDGNRSVLEKAVGLPPSDVAFIDFYDNNGIMAIDTEGLTVSRVSFAHVANFAVLVASSSNVTIEGIDVSDSGSKNRLGRNNSTGGVLLEEGTSNFKVTESTFHNVMGNGVWTHSMYTSPRNADGLITNNTFYNLARDAIQVGHATNVQVLGNRGERIGYPAPLVDVEGGGTPVGVDTAGDVDKSVYHQNSFEEVNGKCIDLDGFHDGTVSQNRCINRGGAEDYVFGHYGIVMNNTNPDMQSENIVIADNYIEGMKFGGIFVIGTGHKIIGNHLIDMNRAGCNESAGKFGCAHFPGEPDLLRTGIYLGQRAERPAIASGNLVKDNEITGYGMAIRCVGFAPQVSPLANTIGQNQCSEGDPK